ncbi:MAG TPA: LuxR family transcriptional regulator [Ktedonobacteraceae bacterium]
MNVPIFIYSQLLATKFFIPVSPHPLISRPRLTTLLQKSLKYSLTLVSAPAGFGKTMLLSAWARSLPANTASVAWVSLDEEDNEPQQFWTYILSSLDQQKPEIFTPLLRYVQSPQVPPLMNMLTLFINLLADSTDCFLLILDDYHVITEPQIHTTLLYLVEHLPSQMHIILASRTDPPLPLSQLRARGQMLEVRTDQLRCTTKETSTFFNKVKGIQFSDEMIQNMTARTEGWLVGLQLLALSLQERDDPTSLLEEASGDQRYILDFLTEEVLQRQPIEVQTFLLSTCILERLTAPLCDAVMEQTDSQQMLKRLEQANLFVVSLDLKRQCYRYHALFAQALRNRLERTHADLVPILHYRASRWYAEHHQTTEAILHAFSAHQWSWAADLIEREHLPLMSFTWGANKHALVRLQQWLKQLPADIMRSRPYLCLTCTQMLWTAAQYPMLQIWLDAAEATLRASLTQHPHADAPSSNVTLKTQQEQQDLLGEVITMRAVLQSYQENGSGALTLCEQALALLSAENASIRIQVSLAQLIAYYASSANNAIAAVESGLRGSILAQAADLPAQAIGIMGTTARYMIGAGRLHEAHQLTQQAMLQGTQPGSPILPEVGWPAVLRADILREWNELDVAHALAEEAISLCEQAVSHASLNFALYAYAVQVRICLSRGELDAAHSALQQFEQIGTHMNQHIYLHIRSLFTTIDQVRLWLACGEMDRAVHWVKQVDLKERHSTPFANEREEVGCVRVLLATAQPVPALQRLEPVLERATIGQRWDHVIEIRLLQALAYQMCQQEIQALDALSQAVQRAEPEGYIRRFIDEGPPMTALLDRLQKEQCKDGPTPYLDTLLVAFAKQSNTSKRQPKQARQRTRRSPSDKEKSSKF